MSKNILVLTGSPRTNGNSEIMADIFLETVSANGHIATKYQTAKKFFRGCVACNSCWKNGNACVLKDDFQEVAPLLESADVLAIVSPLYLFGVTSQLKSVLDKLNAYDSENCMRPLKIKETVLLLCGACEGQHIFGGAVATYENMVSYMQWTNRGIVSVPNVSEKGDILKTDSLDRIKQLALTI